MTAPINLNPLTEREAECLRWAAQGKTSWEIGHILGLSERTANFHIRNACAKMNVRGRQAAIAQALRAGYLDLPAKQNLPASPSPFMRNQLELA